MKKSFVLVCLFVSLISSAFAQYNITPGEGFAALKVGMDIDVFLKILGPASASSFEDEQAGWENSGYDTKKQLVFYLGFDEVYEFDNGTDYCIWKVFVKNRKVVCINISSYGNAGSGARKITLDGRPVFFQSQDVVQSLVGKESLNVTDESSNHEYFYFTKGLSFIINDGEVRNVFIYAKKDKATAKKMKKDLKI